MATKISPWAFVLAVQNLDSSAAYFRDMLGFKLLWQDAADWRLMERDGVRIMLGSCPTDRPAAELGSHSWFGYLNTENVDALHIEFYTRGAQCSAPFDQHYGMREIVVTTPDGHRIVFGEQRPVPAR